MRRPLAWLLIILAAKTLALHWDPAESETGGVNYLGTVGAMLIAMSINWLMVAGYAIFNRPRRWGLIIGLLIGLTIMEYVIAEGVIYVFGITP